MSILRRDPEDKDDILAVLDAAHDRELIDANGYAILKGALDVSDMTAADIMVPRGRMDMIDVDQPLKVLVPRIVEMAHSRFPVYEDSPENVIGMFMTKDMLRIMIEPDLTLRDLIRPAIFIPDAKRLNVLLQEFRTNRNHIALVVDEHGGISGLVTMEDVLEQIVGAIEDEFDENEQMVFHDGLNTWRIMAASDLEDIEQLLQCQFPPGDYDTLGGWLAHALDRIPKRGDRHQFKDIQFEVLRADSRRALWVRARRLPSPQTSEDHA